MFRNVCFTINNYTEDELDQLRTVVTASDSMVKYIIFGREMGKETSTPHLQGYAELATVARLGRVREILGERGHYEQRRGTQQQAIDYCKKDGDWEEYGERKSNGRPVEFGGGEKVANKALPFLERVRNGERVADLLFDPDLSFNVLKHLQAAAPYLEPARNSDDPPPVVTWFWGPTGTGKTRRAVWEIKDKLGENELYVKSDSGVWFDGYDGQKGVVFDDFRSNWFEYSFLLKLLDRYPHRVQYKGGSRQWKPTHIYITCPHRPQDTYKQMQENDANDTIQQLLRRITRTEEMTGLIPWSPPPPPQQPPQEEDSQ